MEGQEERPQQVEEAAAADQPPPHQPPTWLQEDIAAWTTPPQLPQEQPQTPQPQVHSVGHPPPEAPQPQAPLPSPSQPPLETPPPEMPSQPPSQQPLQHFAPHQLESGAAAASRQHRQPHVLAADDDGDEGDDTPDEGSEVVTEEGVKVRKARKSQRKSGNYFQRIHWKSANCHYRRPDVFTSSQWQTDLGSASWYYVTYRALVSVFVFVNFCVYLASMSKVQRDFFFIYLTSQGLLLLTAHQLLDLGLTVAAFVKQSSDPSFRRNHMPFLYRVNWVLYTLCSVCAVMITIFYWAFEFPNSEEKKIKYTGVFVHGINSAIVLSDLCFSAKPWRWLHFYIPLLLGIWYVVFSGIYYAAGGTNHKGHRYIYKNLDYANGAKAASMVCLALVCLIVIHLLFYALYKLRKYIYEHVSGLSKQRQKRALFSIPTPQQTFTEEETGDNIVGPYFDDTELPDTASRVEGADEGQPHRKKPFLSGIPPNLRESALMRKSDGASVALKKEEYEAEMAREEAQRPKTTRPGEGPRIKTMRD